jgi:predicted chitinase
MINREAFYNRIRNTMFHGELSQAVVENIDAILNEYERLEMQDIRQLAYVLGTTFHETAKTMRPIAEYGKGEKHKYGQRVKMNGTPYTQPHIYYGRGYPQVTWWDNYNRLTKANPFGWDFLNEPDLLLQIQPSVWALFYGMRTGMFTGKKLSHYFNDTTCDWINARRIINGVDCAEKVALASKMFLLALT